VLYLQAGKPRLRSRRRIQRSFFASSWGRQAPLAARDPTRRDNARGAEAVDSGPRAGYAMLLSCGTPRLPAGRICVCYRRPCAAVCLYLCVCGRSQHDAGSDGRRGHLLAFPAVRESNAVTDRGPTRRRARSGNKRSRTQPATRLRRETNAPLKQALCLTLPCPQPAGAVATPHGRPRQPDAPTQHMPSLC
jgi:hypothetical protein